MASHLACMTTAYVLIFLSNLPQTLSQTISILPTTPTTGFPACAFACSDLNAASSFCLQTNVGAPQQTVNSCFCQRAEVTPFYEGSTGVCDASCVAESDRSSLQTWFRDFCAAAGFISGGATVTTLITSTRRPTSTATGTSQGSGSGASSSEASAWFSSHWRWVMMVIILFVGLGLITLLAICLKRRHVRKADERRATSSGLASAGGACSPDIGHGRDMWGPHQHMAHTGGWDYTTEQDRAMREASTPTAGGLWGSALGNAKNIKGLGKRTLSKKSKSGSQRRARHAELMGGTGRSEDDGHTRDATASVRRTRSESRREREREREREKEIERGLRGLPLTEDDERIDKSRPPMSEKEKDIEP